jgi:hypothetical protein
MRFNINQTSLPGPILRSTEQNRNYNIGHFTTYLELNSDVNPHTINIKYELKQTEIEKFLKDQDVALALTINCPQTYFYEHIALSNAEEQAITIDESAFLGPVYFSLIIKAVKPIEKFKPAGLMTGFSGLEFKIRTGDVVAVSDELVEVYELPEVKLDNSVFDLNELLSLAPYAFNIDIDGDKIAIGAGAEINKLIQMNMDSGPEGELKNLSAIYLPAVLEVLHEIKNEPKAHIGKVWYEAFEKSMRSQGFDIQSENWQPLEVSQVLLMSPYVELLGGKKK